VGREVERRQAPGERVVEVVDQTGLAAGAEDRVVQARLCEGRPEACMRGRVLCVRLLLECNLGARIADREDADQQADRCDQGGADPDDGAG